MPPSPSSLRVATARAVAHPYASRPRRRPDAELVEELEPDREIEEGGKAGEQGGRDEMTSSFASTKAGTLSGRKMNMKAAPTPTISIPSPFGLA